jgi:nitrogen fixation NifU-like protein
MDKAAVMMDDLRDLYQEVILDHGKSPRNFRRPEDANREARGDNPMCGDKVTVFLKVTPDGVVEDAAFEGRGCAISTASASMMTELIVGRTEAQVKSLFESFHEMCTKEDHEHVHHDALDDEAMEKLQVLAGVRQFPMRVKCATLAWHTMDAALAGGTRISTE